MLYPRCILWGCHARMRQGGFCTPHHDSIPPEWRKAVLDARGVKRWRELRDLSIAARGAAALAAAGKPYPAPPRRARL